VLSLNLEVPEVTETSVLADLLHTLEILSHLGVNVVGNQLGVSSVLNASLSVQEPKRDSVVYNKVSVSGCGVPYPGAWRRCPGSC
jgi:hypothetical protein